jgi:uncharacterized protein (TIGR03089 family)
VVSLTGSAPLPAGAPRDVPDLLRRLLDDDPGRPRLTWYGPGGERVELSAKALDNWVAKTANLLVNELDAGPGSRVVIALPTHWRLVCWLLATWSVGACVVLPGGAAGAVPGAGTPPDADVLVSADPAILAGAGAGYVVAVALPALAAGYGPGLPAGAIDAGSDVRAQGDVFVPLVRPVPGDPALELPAGGRIRYGELVGAAVQAADDAGMPARVRRLARGGPQDVIADLLAPLVRLGSVLLQHDLPALTPDELTHLVTQERAV